MDFLNKSSAQLKDLFGSMTPGARITAALLLAIVVISLGYLVTHQASGADGYLMGGEVFPPRDLPAMEAAFAKAQLGGYEIEGGRIRVPRGQRHVYMAALAEEGALPHNFGDILQRAMDGGSVFEDKHRRQERIKIATERELSLTISAMSSIDSASVLYDEETTGGLRRETVRTASVSVRPVGGQPLDESLVPSIRSIVAAAFAGLKTGDVAVTDLNGGRSFRGSSDGLPSAMDDPYLARKRFHEGRYKGDILEVLSYVPGVIVTCNAQLGREKIHREEEVKHDPKPVAYQVTDSSTTRTHEGGGSGGVPGFRSQAVTNTSASLNTAGPSGPREEESATERQESSVVSSVRTETEMAAHPVEQVTVAVAVPESYFKKVWLQRNPPETNADGTAEPKTPEPAELETIRTQEVSNIRSCVAALLPKPAGVTNPTDLVTVTVFPDFKPEVLPGPGMGAATLTWLANSYSTLGMIGLALFSILTLRSMVRAAPAPALAPLSGGEAGLAVAAAAESDQHAESQDTAEDRRRRFNTSGASLKDELTELVASDPDTAASILRNWIGSAP